MYAILPEFLAFGTSGRAGFISSAVRLPHGALLICCASSGETASWREMPTASGSDEPVGGSCLLPVPLANDTHMYKYVYRCIHACIHVHIYIIHTWVCIHMTCVYRCMHV